MSAAKSVSAKVNLHVKSREVRCSPGGEAAGGLRDD